MTDSTLQIIHDFPPNIDQIDAKFKIKDRANILFCYGNTLYNPDGLDVPEHILVHERVHAFRQVMEHGGPAKWWDRYIQDPVFRINEEVLAHRAEFGWFCKDNHDRNVKIKYLHFICGRLSGPLYGNMITYPVARQMITGYGSNSPEPELDDEIPF